MDRSTGIRKIIHVDMDAFYTSIEQRDRPELRGKPVVVGGSPDKRGVVASASYEARKFGIRSAMSSAKAYRLCPSVVFICPNFEKYSRASEQIHQIFYEVTDLVEPLALDEAYLDVTENKLNEPVATKVAKHIKQQIQERLHLTASAGVASNKFLAKIASDLKKPNGLATITPDKALDFIAKLPVEKLWGVGPATAKRLHALNINVAGDLRNWSAVDTEQALGRHGLFLRDLAHGVDPRVVEPNQEAKSCGSETTFEKDILKIEDLILELHELSDHLAAQLRALGKPARSVTLKIRYKDFKTITRSRTLERFTDSSEVIEQTAVELLQKNTEAGVVPIRLLGISLSLQRESAEREQLTFDFI